MDGYDPNSAVMDGRMSDVMPTKPFAYAPPRPYQPLPFGQPRMAGGIGGLFSRLQGMDDETFTRAMDRYGQFRERFGGGFQPNMFGSFAGMDDEGFSRGMERLSQYAERFGGSNPMFRNFRMPAPASEGSDMAPAGTPINGSADPVTGGQTPQPSYQPPQYGPVTRPYYNTGFGSANPYMPRNPYAGGYGMGYNSYSGGMGGGKGGGSPYSGRPAGGGKGGGQPVGGYGI